MKFQSYLMEQIQKHPSIQIQDLVKLCYQAAYGAEHLLQDIERAQNYFLEEYQTVQAREGSLYEPLSEDICRVNLTVWKQKKLPWQWLFRMFCASAKEVRSTNKDVFLRYIKQAKEISMQDPLRFSAEDWALFWQEYESKGMPAVHHTKSYRSHEQPSYRVVQQSYLRVLPILEKAAVFSDSACMKVIALDGRAASGKTTMTSQLRWILGASVICMDDFFLPLECRNAQRFAVPGNNIHYERFIKEVLPFISCENSFTYHRFDCSQMKIAEKVEIDTQKWRIVEGSYSCHPLFGNYADITVFSDISPQEQMQRILQRNGTKMAEKFRDQWIPMEEAYFTAYHIKENADLCV